jgi:hypothetical protein
MTFEQAKDQVAKNHGYESFNDFRRHKKTARAVEDLLNEAAELYAKSKLEQETTNKPFLGWTNDKDILNQQREYWGAMNGLKFKDAQIEELKNVIKSLREMNKKLMDDLIAKNQEIAEIEAHYSSIGLGLKPRTK